jgi:hypothetical protein
MKNKLMLGLWRYIINVPPFLWQKQIAQGKRNHRIRGAYMIAEQMVYVTRIIQSAIFGFNDENQKAQTTA